MPSRRSTPKSKTGNGANPSPTPVRAATPIKKRAAGKKRAVGKKQIKMPEASNRDQFRLLDLPNELRLRIYNFILPRHERIFLDSSNFYRPLPYVRESYGSTFAFLQLNKQVHDEATQYIYSHNTVNIIKPWNYVQRWSSPQDFLARLGPKACHYITRLECHLTRDIGDLGHAWNTMIQDCPNLEHLRLVFYHSTTAWAIQAAQIANYIQNWSTEKAAPLLVKTEPDTHGQPHKTQVMNQPPVLEVELYDSIWMGATREGSVGECFDLDRAAMNSRIFPLRLPAQIKKVTVTASVQPGLCGWFDRWKPRSTEGNAWGWERVDQKPSLHGMQNTMRFVDGAATKVTVEEETSDSDSDGYLY